MNNNNEFPYRAYAMEYGTFLGIAWTAVFFPYTASFRTASALYSLLAFFGFMSLAIIPFIFAWRVKQLQDKGKGLGFFRGCIFALNLFMFACLFTGICEYVYFAFFDNGTLIDSFTKMITDPEIKNAYSQMGMGDTYSQFIDSTKQLQILSSFQKVEALFNMNIFVSLLMTIPVGLVASLKKS